MLVFTKGFSVFKTKIITRQIKLSPGCSMDRQPGVHSRDKKRDTMPQLKIRMERVLRRCIGKAERLHS